MSKIRWGRYLKINQVLVDPQGTKVTVTGRMVPWYEYFGEGLFMGFAIGLVVAWAIWA